MKFKKLIIKLVIIIFHINYQVDFTRFITNKFHLHFMTSFDGYQYFFLYLFSNQEWRLLFSFSFLSVFQLNVYIPIFIKTN